MFDEVQWQNKKHWRPIEHSYYFKHIPIYLLTKTHKSLLNKRRKKTLCFYIRDLGLNYTQAELQKFRCENLGLTSLFEEGASSLFEVKDGDKENE